MDHQDPNDPRSRVEKIVDRLLLLNLYERVNQISWISGDVKLQKLVFLSEKNMQENDVDGFNYKFFRWDHGPMSKGVYEDHDFLQSNELVSDRGQMTDEGEEILRSVQEVFDQNPDVTSFIEQIVEIHGETPGNRLKQTVYDKEIELPNGRARRIEDIPPGTDVMIKLNEDEADVSFELPEGWIETLEILLSKDYRSVVSETQEIIQVEESETFAAPQ